MSIVQIFMAGLISLILSSVAPCTGHADDVTEKQVIKIGAVDDAWPFVWLDENTQQYFGFLWAVCAEGVHCAGFQFTATTVTVT